MASRKIKRQTIGTDAVFFEDSSTTTESHPPSKSDLTSSVLTDLLDAKRWTMTKLEESDKKIKDLNQSIERIEKQNEQFQAKMDDKLEKTQESIRSSEIRSVQVLGTLAALISLVLAYVNIAGAQKDLLNAFASALPLQYTK
jgi:septal ring factor EnvC (AmiA/AmiB activator)